MVNLPKMAVPTSSIRLLLLSCLVVCGQAISEIGDIVEDIPVNVTIAEGETAILPCRVGEHEDQSMVVWMNPKRIVVSQKESRFIDDPRLSIERPFVGDYNLHIRDVKYEDRGDYMCTVNTQPIIIKRIRLIVQVPSRILDYSDTNIVTVAEGNDVELLCNATGIPPPKITWYRRMGDIPLERERVGFEGELLLIRNISRHCGGIYECMAYNGVPSAVTREIEVKVQFKPEIKLLTKRLGQYVDKETMLRCIITASPQGSNIWRFGNIQPNMKEGWRYRLEVYEDSQYTVSLSLQIKNVRSEDFGNYTCEASNKLGYASKQMELYEYFVPTPPRTTTYSTTKYRRPYPQRPRPVGRPNGSNGRYDRVTIPSRSGNSAQIHKSSSETQILGNRILLLTALSYVCWITEFLVWIDGT